MRRIFAIIALSVLILPADAPAQSQLTPQQAFGSPLDKLFESGNRSLGYILPLPFEEVVNESEYIVGPNDVFNFQIPGVAASFVQLLVSPEGKLVIPNGRQFQASGKSLGTLKEEVRKSFKTVESILTLSSPRQFVVTVLGAVTKPGSYITSAVLRVDKLLALAIVQSPGQPKQFSTRRIILRRKDSEDKFVDLDKFYALRKTEDNPFLREGDIIVVPPLKLDQAGVSVYGAVNAPNQYEFREGDRLGVLLSIALGLTPNADSTSVELTRFSSDGALSKTSVMDVSAVLRGEAEDIPLQNKDRIVVREITDRRGDFKVHVRGEVRFPGIYPITRDSTLLSEVIRRAGGFTEFAFLPMAEVERRQVTADETVVDLGREALRNLRMTDQLVTPEERAYYDLESGLRRGTVAADFPGLFERGDPSEDLWLRDGDVIFIPHSQHTVYVYGQVARPGYVTYKEGADTRFYIEKAGGYGEEAETGGTRVIKGKTREWLSPPDATIEPGDYIWVPKDIRYPTGYYLNLVSQAASFVSVVLSMTVIILQLTR